MVHPFYEVLSLHPHKSKLLNQLLKDYEETLAILRTYCKNKIVEKTIQLDQLTNMDKIPLKFNIPVNRTVDKTRKTTVSIRITMYYVCYKRTPLKVIVSDLNKV